MTISALALLVPEAGPLVGELRTRYDPSGRAGFPPHVTLLAPFVPPEAVTEVLLASLRAFFARIEPFDLELARTGRFPETVYLAPEPVQRLRSLIEALASRFPEHPPYAGEFAEVVPHLTVAHGCPEATLAAIERILATELPVRTQASVVVLMVGDGETWSERARFVLGTG